MKLSDILSVLDGFAPVALQESWDNAGLLYGDPEMEVTGAVVAFDCTRDVVMEAVSLGANLVITHHPLVFKGIKKFVPGDPVGDALVAAVKNDVAVYAAHTNADKVYAGVSGAMAAKLGLVNLDFLDNPGGDSGLGMIGDLREPMECGAFVSMVKDAFGCSSVRTSRPLEGMVSRVALCGGSGSEFAGLAMQRGAQVYVTADISYHNFYTKEGFMVMDIGHYESEVEIVSILNEVLKKNFPNFATYIAKAKRNPVYYL